MIVRQRQVARDTERHVVSTTWESTRLLVARDGMGFSFHVTTMFPGTSTRMCYRHHLEAVYCISGRGEVEVIASGARHAVRTGTLYALDRHDDHVLHAHTRLVLACVFNPPVRGDEVHDETGAYPPGPPSAQFTSPRSEEV